MATLTHTRGDTLPLVLSTDAVAMTLQVHTVGACVEIEGSLADGAARFAPAALDGLRPGRVYRTTARTTLADGATQTIDGPAVLILEGCGSLPPAPPVGLISADTIITPATIIQEAA